MALGSDDSDQPGSRVPLDGYAMHLRPSELNAVAARLHELGTFGTVDTSRLPDALRRLPAIDRPPAWELAMRHLGRRKQIELAASELGIDVVHARELLGALSEALATGRAEPDA